MFNSKIPLHKSIRTKLVVVSIIVEITMLGLLLSNSMRLLNQTLEEQTQAKLAAISPLLDSALSARLFERDHAGIREILSKLMKSQYESFQYIVVYDNRGIVYAQAGKIDIHQMPATDNNVSNTFTTGIYNSSTQLTLGNDKIGEVRYGLSLQSLINSRDNLIQQGFIIASIEVMLTFILLSFGGFLLTRHILTLMSATQQVAAGNHSIQIPITSSDEIGMLASNFNVMTKAIHDRIGALHISEQALFEEKERAEITLQSIGDAVMTTDIEGNIVNMNPVAEQLTGWTLSEAQGLPLSSIYHIVDLRNQLPPDNPVQYVLQHGNIVGLTNQTSLISRNAAVVHQVTHSAAPLMNKEGQVSGIVLVFHDVTEQYRQQALIVAHEAELKKVTDILPSPVTRVDLEDRYLFASKAFEQWFGNRPEDVIGHKRNEVIGAEIYNRMEPYVQRALAGEPVTFEMSIPNPAGGSRETIISLLPDHDSNGVVCGFYTIGVDITERKQAEQATQELREQLTQATKMEAVGHLTAGIAHDFNNILGAILGYAELSKHIIADGKPDDVERYLTEILKASNRAKELIAQMLTFSRLSPDLNSGEAPVTLLTPVVKEVVSLLRSSIPSSIALNYHVESEDIKARIQPIHLHQIILNLGINARDAIGEYGKINIELSVQQQTQAVCASCKHPFSGSYAKIMLQDSGSGIPKNILNKIFDPFFTTKGVGKGTGMGLSVVHGLAHSLGGHIMIESNEGTGSSINIFLPLAASSPHSPNELSEKILPPSSLPPIRIMVVDDEEVMASMMYEVLTIHGAHIKLFLSPLEAVEYFKLHLDEVDMVITDETMPGLSGMHMAKQFLTLKPGLPVILCTGYSEHATAELANTNGLAAFFYKPIHMDELLIKIHEIWQNRSQV